MEFSHVPVLLEECIDALNIKPDGIYVDATLGGAGHSTEICKRLSPEGMLIGIDRDGEALAVSSKRLEHFDCRKKFIQGNYADIKSILKDLGIVQIDGALLDLGVSSYQLDNPERGFSYMQDAELDMRMDRSDKLTASVIVNEYPEKKLHQIIKEYGEERWASRIASFIVKERKKKQIESTFELVDIIKSAIPVAARRSGPHPAKRTFQAIRIEVNDELGGLKTAVEDFIDVLAPGGRLAIISFHSLEDRIVKEAFKEKEEPCICPREIPVCACGKKAVIKKVNKKPIIPSEAQEEANPRARSAKLRVCEKLFEE